MMRKAIIISTMSILTLSAHAVADNIQNLQVILQQHNTSFQALFPNIGASSCTGSQIYTEAGLEAAMKKFPDFLNSTDQNINERELAAFFANIAHETTGGWSTAPQGPYAWGLCFSHEVNCTNSSCQQYTVPNQKYPPAPGMGYYGRGPIQLSYNYNYGQARDAIKQIDSSFPDILSNPDLVQEQATVAWETALWFWMTPQAPKPSAHTAITATPGTTVTDRPAGFGLTIDIINGGIECGVSGNAQAQNRTDHYEKWFGAKLGLTQTDYKDDTCENIKPF